MTIAEHTHEELATKEDVADYKVAISDVILNLANSQIQANERMNSFEAEFREIRTILAELIESNREMTESNLRVIGSQTTEDE